MQESDRLINRISKDLSNNLDNSKGIYNVRRTKYSCIQIAKDNWENKETKGLHYEIWCKNINEGNLFGSKNVEVFIGFHIEGRNDYITNIINELEKYGIYKTERHIVEQTKKYLNFDNEEEIEKSIHIIIDEVKKLDNKYTPSIDEVIKNDCKVDKMNLNELKKLLNEASNISKKIPMKEKTFMDISGYPHYENVSSNILAFYFNPAEEHKLNAIVIGALLKVIKNKNINLVQNENIKELNVYREYTTIKGNRLDLVLQNEELVIGIENKIDATVYNDLNDYANTLNKISKNSIKVLLSLNPNDEIVKNTEFINITYQEFFKQLKIDLNSVPDKNNKWYIYLEEFIKNLENFEGELEMEEEIINWLQINKKEIEELNKVKEIANKSIYKKQEELKKILENKLQINYIKFWTGDISMTCYIDSPLKYHVDANLTQDGWKIGVFSWTVYNGNKMRQLLSNSDYKIIEEEGYHEWLYKFDYNYPQEKIVEKVIEIYHYIEERFETI